MVTAMWFAVPKPKGGGYRLLQPEEAATVRGGSSTGGSATSTSLINIPLDNVPYITQHLNPKNKSNTSQQITRSSRYCGIASALMVRDKAPKDAQFPPVWYENGNNFVTADQAMKTIDDNLLNGKYGYVYEDRKIDVLGNKGLLYIKNGITDTAANRASQYNNTVDILKGVYTGKLGDPKNSSSDNIFLDSHHVSSVSMQPISAVSLGSTAKLSEATKAIWNHINNYHQPVVVVVDSNKQIGNSVKTSTVEPTLHYIVIKGIYEDSSGGTRHFLIHDPSYFMTDYEYNEVALRQLIALPYNTPAWVYNYGYQTVGAEPAYILTVQGD
jgi:hypothetical protein